MAKLRNYPLMLLVGGAISVFPGCIDKSFDLDNIDDTARLEVKDLTLPLEFTGAVTFEDVVGDLEAENDLVHVDADGNYILIQDNFFESDVIEINPIVAEANVENFDSEELTFPAVSGVPVDLTALNVGEYAKFPFEFDFDLVDNYIRDITSATVVSAIDFKVQTGLDCKLTDLSFSIPKGMDGYLESKFNGSFDPTTGKITFKEVQVSATSPFIFKFHVTELNIKEAGGKFTYHGNGENGVFHLQNEISLNEGKLVALQSGEAHIVASFGLEPIDIKTISGSLKYEMENITEYADIYDMLPELLKDPQTRLALIDPQLYVSVDNPFAKYGCSASTKVTLNQIRTDAADYLPESQKSVTTSAPVEIVAPDNFPGDYYTDTFVFSGTEHPTFIYDKFPGAKPVLLKNLGNIIYGKGLPESLEFVFTNPVIDSDKVRNLPIGKPIGRVTGRYCFYAPLNFADGSQIVYSQEQTGWDLSDMVINKFEITTTVTSTVPVDVVLSAHPIVKDDRGNYIVDNNVKVSSTVIEANAKNKPVVIKMEGPEVKNLDGMKYTVTLNSKGNGGLLGENSSLEMNQVRVTVSGYYDFYDSNDEGE
ncbi:MAG: hypothetical protein K2K82_02365 [Muribaculaceae bacterium]|nr:hypothetical protein [Muribaculaceae bacterium]